MTKEKSSLRAALSITTEYNFSGSSKDGPYFFMKERLKAKEIAALVKEAGGSTYYVGGCVRDRLMGIESKDIDVEVHGISIDVLEDILRNAGTPFTKGAGFGVFGLKGYELDIAMPRKEELTGKGHKDFRIDVDPYIGTLKASERRDFTVNALMEDVLTGEITDHFGGQEDLAKGILRHVSSSSFGEDPLRVLRAAQFAARFSFDIAPETIALCSKMNLSYLPAERIMGELEKALLKAERPSVFFEMLRKMNQLDVWFPEIEKLIGVMQNPKYHPEGDVWNHTMLVLDEAAKLKDETSYPLGFMVTSLMHDAGKPETTTVDEDGRIRSIGHELCLDTVRTALKRFTNEARLIKYVLNMTKLHMRPNQLAYQKSKQKAVNKLLDLAISPEDLILFAKADHFGRTEYAPYDEVEKYLNDGLASFNELMSKPYVTGQDLINAGLKPGVQFNELLKKAHDMRLAGIDKEIILKEILK